MKRNKLFILVSILCLVLILSTTLLVSGCSGGGPAAEVGAKTPIKIGAMIPLTGDFAMWGDLFKNSFQFALDEAKNQVAGRPIQLIVADEGGYDVTAALAAAKKLAESDKVDVMMAPFFGGSTLAVTPYTSKLPIVSVKYALSATDEIAPNYVFSSGVRFQDSTYSVGVYAYDVMGLRTATLIGSDFSVGHDFAAGFVDGFTSRGGKVVQQQFAPLSEADYSPYLSALKPADALVSSVCGPPAEIALFSAYDKLGLSKKMPFVVAEGGSFPPDVISQMGDKLLGVIGSQLYLPGLDNAQNKQFKTAFKAKYNQDPDNMVVTAYAAMVSVLKGLEATNGDATAAKLAPAMSKLQLDLPQGKFSYSPERFGVQDLFITKIDKVNGVNQWVSVKTYPQIQPYKK